MGLGWREHDGFTRTEKTRMLCSSQEGYQELRKSIAISTSTNLYGICRIPLKFEVEQDTIEISVLMDECYGTVLQCILKESKKDVDVTDHVIKVVRVPTRRTSEYNFDIADSVVPKSAVGVPLQAYCSQSTVHSQ
jgi:DNA polymerase III alpha subunit